MRKKTKKIAFLGLSVALALILSYVESLLPPLSAAVPGIKMGLPNIVIIFLLYRLSGKEAFGVSIVRIFLNFMLFGNPMTVAYSVAGAILSLCVMALMKRIDLFSTVGVSIAGGIFHNLGQIIVAGIVLENQNVWYYFPMLFFTGILAGAIIGILGSSICKKVLLFSR